MLSIAPTLSCRLALQVTPGIVAGRGSCFWRHHSRAGAGEEAAVVVRLQTVLEAPHLNPCVALGHTHAFKILLVAFRVLRVKEGLSVVREALCDIEGGFSKSSY